MVILQQPFAYINPTTIASDAETDGCVLPWVRSCEAIVDEPSCKKASCQWQPGRTGDGEYNMIVLL